MSEGDKLSFNTRGVTFFELLTIAFVCLKLTGYIDWSWWYILMPTWLPFLIAVVSMTVIYVYYKWK